MKTRNPIIIFLVILLVLTMTSSSVVTTTALSSTDNDQETIDRGVEWELLMNQIFIAEDLLNAPGNDFTDHYRSHLLSAQSYAKMLCDSTGSTIDQLKKMKEDLSYMIRESSNPVNLERDGHYTVVFTNTLRWDTVNYYIWDENDQGVYGWPGMEIVSSYNNPFGQKQYGVLVPEAFGNIVFNDGTFQTEDIALSGNIGVYFDGSSDSQGHYIASIWELTPPDYPDYDAELPIPTEKPTEPTQAATEPLPKTQGKFGDTDGDGKVSIADVTHIQRVLADLSAATKYRRFLGDVNATDQLDIVDATEIQRQLAGFFTLFPAEKEEGRIFRDVQIDNVKIETEGEYYTRGEIAITISAFTEDRNAGLEYEILADGEVFRKRGGSPICRVAYELPKGQAIPFTYKVYTDTGFEDSVTIDVTYPVARNLKITSIDTEEGKLNGSQLCYGSTYTVKPKVILTGDENFRSCVPSFYYTIDGTELKSNGNYSGISDPFQDVFSFNTGILGLGIHTIRLEASCMESTDIYEAKFEVIAPTEPPNDFDPAIFTRDTGVIRSIEFLDVENIITKSLPNAQPVAFKEYYRGVFTYDPYNEEGFPNAKDRAAVICNRTQLENFLKDYAIPYQDQEERAFTDSEFDDAFFEEHALIILTYNFYCETNYIRIKSLSVKDNTLFIDADEIVHHDPDMPYATAFNSYAISVNVTDKSVLTSAWNPVIY